MSWTINNFQHPNAVPALCKGFLEQHLNGWIGTLPGNLGCIYRVATSVPKGNLDFGYHPAPEKFCTL